MSECVHSARALFVCVCVSRLGYIFNLFAQIESAGAEWCTRAHLCKGLRVCRAIYRTSLSTLQYTHSHTVVSRPVVNGPHIYCKQTIRTKGPVTRNTKPTSTAETLAGIPGAYAIKCAHLHGILYEVRRCVRACARHPQTFAGPSALAYVRLYARPS